MVHQHTVRGGNRNKNIADFQCGSISQPWRVLYTVAKEPEVTLTKFRIPCFHCACRLGTQRWKIPSTEYQCLFRVTITCFFWLCWCPNLLIVCNNRKANIKPIKIADAFIMFLTWSIINSLFVLSFKPLEPQLNFRRNLHNSGFKLQDLQDFFFQPFISNKHKWRKNPNEAVKNGHNWPMLMLRLLGTDPSTLQTTCSSLRFNP